MWFAVTRQKSYRTLDTSRLRGQRAPHRLFLKGLLEGTKGNYVIKDDFQTATEEPTELGAFKNVRLEHTKAESLKVEMGYRVERHNDRTSMLHCTDTSKPLNYDG